MYLGFLAKNGEKYFCMTVLKIFSSIFFFFFLLRQTDPGEGEKTKTKTEGMCLRKKKIKSSEKKYKTELYNYFQQARG